MDIRVQSGEIEVPADDPFRDDLLGRREAVNTLFRPRVGHPVTGRSRSSTSRKTI